MDLMSRLQRIASADPDVRRRELLSMLDEMKAPYSRYRDSAGKLEPENIVVSFSKEDEPRYVVGAHYDSALGSTGANDNGAGVCILLEVVQHYLLHPPSVPQDIMFFDLEEVGIGGSLGYLERFGIEKISGMVNLDICGVGDTILAAPGMYAKEGYLRESLEKVAQSGQHKMQIVDRLPPGDDRVFEGRRIPTITACIVPQADVEPLLVLSKFIDERRGEPPTATPSIMETFHNASRDSINVIETPAMEKMLAWTLDLMKAL